jgi:hypothetical protein
MNERIEDIARQCMSMKFFVDTASEEFDYNKFAELIVRECQRQVEEQYKPVLEDKEMMKDTHWDGYVQGGVDCYVAISEHFYGVEE